MNDDQPISDQQADPAPQHDSPKPQEPPAADEPQPLDAQPAVGANLVFAQDDKQPPDAQPADDEAAVGANLVFAQDDEQPADAQPGDEQLPEEVAVQDVEDRPIPACADIKPVLEALLFAADGPVTASRLAEVTGSPTAAVKQALAELQVSYNLEGRGFTLEEIAGGYQLFSRPKYAEWIERFQRKQTRTKLSGAALETLAIIAYKQPIGRADIESVRGVQAGPILRMLMDKGMIHIVGRQEVIGRPFLYGTTRRFLEHFGLKSLADLPQAEQLQMP